MKQKIGANNKVNGKRIQMIGLQKFWKSLPGITILESRVQNLVIREDFLTDFLTEKD